MSEEESKEMDASQQPQDRPVEKEGAKPEETVSEAGESRETGQTEEAEVAAAKAEGLTVETEDAVPGDGSETIVESETAAESGPSDQEQVEAKEPVQPLKIPEQSETPVDCPDDVKESPFSDERIQRILDIEMPVNVSFGSTRRPLCEVLKLGPGALLELDRAADEPVVLKVNNKIFAKGEIVDVDGYYGVQITEISSAAQRIASLGD